MEEMERVLVTIQRLHTDLEMIQQQETEQLDRFNEELAKLTAANKQVLNDLKTICKLVG